MNKWFKMLCGVLAVVALTGGTTAPSDGFIFDIGDNVPPAQVKLIKNALTIAQSYLNKNYGGAIDPAFQAHVVVKIEATGRGNQELGGGGGNATGLDETGARPYFDVAHKDWKQDTRGRGWSLSADQTKVVIHEYVHGWQSWLGAMNIHWQPLGNWINEGMAEYIAYSAVISTGKMSKRNVDKFMLVGALSAETAQPLSVFGSDQTPAWPGHVGYLAIDWLVSESPNGPMSLRIIGTEIAAGKSAGMAFRSAFNIELKDFYAQFEVWRQMMLKHPSTALAKRPKLVNIGE